MNIRRRQLIAVAALSLVPFFAAAQFGWDDEPAAGVLNQLDLFEWARIKDKAEVAAMVR